MKYFGEQIFNNYLAFFVIEIIENCIEKEIYEIIYLIQNEMEYNNILDSIKNKIEENKELLYYQILKISQKEEELYLFYLLIIFKFLNIKISFINNNFLTNEYLYNNINKLKKISNKKNIEKEYQKIIKIW